MKALVKMSIRLSLIIIALGGAFMVNAQEKWDPDKKKVILITGTASGMGKAFAEKLTAEGHIVYGGDIQYEKNQQQLTAIGAHPLNMDVTKDEEVKAGVDKIIEEQGRIDVLINNAGYGLFAPAEEATIEDAKQQFDVNVFGYARTVKAVLPHMRKQGYGRIVNLTSMGGKIYMPLGSWYHASKHALEGWSDCLRLEVNQFNIDVVILEPGIINTNFYNVAGKITEKYKEGTAYGHLMDGMSMSNDGESGMSMTEPEVIADVMSKIVKKKNPKIRYKKGRMAKFLIFYRNTFGDKAYDRIILMTMRRSSNS